MVLESEGRPAATAVWDLETAVVMRGGLARPSLTGCSVILRVGVSSQSVPGLPQEERLEGHRDDPRTDRVCFGAGAREHPEASLPMQVQESLETPKIASHRPRCCLHFQREDPAAGLDDEIDFMPSGGAPRAQLRARIPPRGPCPELVADPCLEPGTPRPGLP